MSKQLNFTKMAGTGNDFIVIDHRYKNGVFPKSFIQRLTHRQNGIGADGILFLGKPRATREAHLRMRIFNPDGSEAQMCGNGIRCLAYYAYEHQIAPARMRIQTWAGVLEAQVKGKNQVRAQLPLPKQWKLGLSFHRNGIQLCGCFVNIGVPHTVFLVDDLERVDVAKLGSWIRFHKAFAPKGTNVNFVKFRGGNRIEVRTYERGVEAETLACGTGVTASALAVARQRGLSPPVQVMTKSGEVLKVDFQQSRDSIEKVWLEGAVKIVFRGVIENV